eukprot:TRINITY_DN61937_c0_g1_i1.p1 TRINITY_DN61937_c0_g1~~TRINITY_DN61937_c0_g1_i1.p1  ORF type:complete len:963 (+),score=152.03 TRINITY_DN61937_c0_g1_i1:58-2889(+)
MGADGASGLWAPDATFGPVLRLFRAHALRRLGVPTRQTSQEIRTITHAIKINRHLISNRDDVISWLAEAAEVRNLNVKALSFDLSLAEQASLLARSALLVSSAGSNQMSGLFLRAGAGLLLLPMCKYLDEHNKLNCQSEKLLAAYGLRFAEYPVPWEDATYDMHRGFSINIRRQLLDSLLDGLLGAPDFPSPVQERGVAAQLFPQMPADEPPLPPSWDGKDVPRRTSGIVMQAGENEQSSRLAATLESDPAEVVKAAPRGLCIVDNTTIAIRQQIVQPGQLMKPPSPEENPYHCMVETQTKPSRSSVWRVPCYLDCEGPDFDPSWGRFRRLLQKNAAQDFPLDNDLFNQANELLDDFFDDQMLALSMQSCFVVRMRLEFLKDSLLKGACLLGYAAASFIMGRHLLDPSMHEIESNGEVIDAPAMALTYFENALELLSDRGGKSKLEVGFLESSSWPVRVEDILINVELQRKSPGHAFGLFSKVADSPGLQRVPDRATVARSGCILPRHLQICGVGDHLPATLDVVMMTEAALESQDACTEGISWTFTRSFLGRFCPRHAWQGHQCRQRCQLLGIGCGLEPEAPDPIESWLAGVFDPDTLDELQFDLGERTRSLREVARRDARLAEADFVVCSHPAMLCVLLAEVLAGAVFTHASSTLLFGLPCSECAANGKDSTLRTYNMQASSAASSYLWSLRRLLLAESPKGLSFVAEGPFLSEQVYFQLGVRVPWAPPLALYVERGGWKGGNHRLRQALVLRSRFFNTLTGEHWSSLSRETISISGQPLNMTFVGWQERWLSLEVMAGYSAAVLWPNDLHQRTFHEVYRMGMPLFLPGDVWLYRLQLNVNWGYSSYAGRLPLPIEESFHEPWWNAYSETISKVMFWQQFADWQQLPHVQRFTSIPDLLQQLLTADLEVINKMMLVFHETLVGDTLTLMQEQLGTLRGKAQ